MSIEMVRVKSSNVRAIGLNGRRILVQFDNGVYECERADGSHECATLIYERFLKAESKGRFYSEEIRRKPDVWRVRKLDDHLMAQVHEGGRVTIEPEQIDKPQMSGVDKHLADERQRMEEFMAGKDFRPTPARLAQHAFSYGGPQLDETAGMAFDPCRNCGLPRKHPAHYQESAQVSEPATEESLRPRALIEKNYRGIRRLILLVGLPRSGKSSWARMTGFPIVSPDAIRLALHGQAYIQPTEPLVWILAKYFVHSLFLAGHETVILDACNVSRARRDEWRGSEWETVCQVFDVSREESRSRVLWGSGKDTCGDAESEALLEAIDRMAKNFEPLGDDEKRYEGVRLELSPLTVAALDPSNLTAAGLALLEREMYLQTGFPDLKTGLPLDVLSALTDDDKPKE